MLPELNQEDIETGVCTLQVLGTKKTGKRTSRLLQLERGDVPRPSDSGRELPKVFCSRQHRFVTSQHGYAKTHL